MKLICVTGYPLGGKTTLACWLAERYKAEYWCSGDFAREHGLDPLEQGIRERGISLLLNEQIMREAYRRIKQAEGLLVMDGYPRSYEQIALVRGRTPLVLFVMVDAVTMVARMTGRRRSDDVAGIVGGKVLASLELYRQLREEEGIVLRSVNGGEGDWLKQEGAACCEQFLVG